MSGVVHDRDALTLGPGAGLRVPLDGVQTVGIAIPIPEPHGAFLQGKRASFNDPMAPLIPAHVTLLGPTGVPLPDFARLGDHLTEVARDLKETEDKLVQGANGAWSPVRSFPLRRRGAPS